MRKIVTKVLSVTKGLQLLSVPWDSEAHITSSGSGGPARPATVCGPLRPFRCAHAQRIQPLRYGLRVLWSVFF